MLDASWNQQYLDLIGPVVVPDTFHADQTSLVDDLIAGARNWRALRGNALIEQDSGHSRKRQDEAHYHESIPVYLFESEFPRLR